MKSSQNTFEVLHNATKAHHYKKLIAQLNKDLQLANLDCAFKEGVSPEVLKNQLCDLVFRCINQNFADYLNLLYIIDVSESQIKDLDGSDIVLLTENVVFLILKREYQKVWYKEQYG